VPRDSLVLRGAILENFVYGWPSATETVIVPATKAGDAHAFIDWGGTLSQTLSTRVI